MNPVEISTETALDEACAALGEELVQRRLMAKHAAARIGELEAEVERLTAERDAATTPILPDGAEAWSLPNRRLVFPTEGGYVASWGGTWISGVRPTIQDWLTDPEGYPDADATGRG